MILIAVCYSILSTAAYAQHFEGELNMSFHNVEDNETEDLVLFIKENRLTLSGDLRSYADFPLLRDALTIRSDRDDVLIHSKDQVAVVNLKDIEMLIKQLMPGAAANTPDMDEVEGRASITETGETKRFKGYEARQIIVKDSENESRETHIWLTDLNIDWSQLLSPVVSLGKSFGGDLDISNWDWPLSETPMLIEYFDNGELTMKAEMTEVKARSLLVSETDIAEGKRVISLFQLMMQPN